MFVFSTLLNFFKDLDNERADINISGSEYLPVMAITKVKSTPAAIMVKRTKTQGKLYHRQFGFLISKLLSYFCIYFDNIL